MDTRTTLNIQKIFVQREGRHVNVLSTVTVNQVSTR